jgi:enamine deaminase RidA (YjgF/YER057c/UK114 family)
MNIASEMTPTMRLAALGIQLPQPWGSAGCGQFGPHVLGPGVAVYAEFVRVVGRRAVISGHLPLDESGAVAGPYGRVGAQVTPEQAQACAARAMLSIFASLRRELGTLDRIAAWVRLYGMVSATPEFRDYPSVINGASRLIYDVFGNDVGRHARVAIGIAGLPFDVPVEIEAEVELR